jgi:predicted enzyme related to lactoylglutathione lyase
MNLLVNLEVDDLEKAVRFYSSLFELKVGRRFGAFGVEMLGSSAPIYLLVKAPGTPASSASSQRRSYERHWTPVHLDFVVEEIEPAVANAISGGAQLEKPIVTLKWGRNRRVNMTPQPPNEAFQATCLLPEYAAALRRWAPSLDRGSILD